MKGFLFFSMLVLALNACTIAGKAKPGNENNVQTENGFRSDDKLKDSNAKPISDGKIRKIDFQNFTYEPFCAGEEPTKVTVKNGEFSEEKQEDGYTDRFYFTLLGTTYGDVNGDGNEDAVILSNCNTGGTGQFTEGFIYELKNDKPTLLARIAGGDRAYGGLAEARIENGILAIDSYDVGEEGGACCPEFVVTTHYKISGGKLSEVGKAERRELYPAQKVSFPKGATSTTLKVKFTKEEDRKRFSVGAKKGQILRVTSPEKIYGDIRKGDADAKNNNEGFIATLNETGEFVIEVQYFTDTEKEISLTIEIR